jgi:hypothetical protein
VDENRIVEGKNCLNLNSHFLILGAVRSVSKDEESRDANDAEDLTIEMTEAEREKIQLVTKKLTLWDVFRGEDQLNKVNSIVALLNKIS